MKKQSLAASLTALALILGLTPAWAANTTYLDVDRAAWYATSVAFCQQHQLMDGLTQKDFAPQEPLTRAALAESLYRLAGSPAPAEPQEEPDEEQTFFPDVGEDHPNLAAILWAKENGVVSGYEDGTFGPEAPITREQIAALLWNQQGGSQREQESPAAPFTDGEAISAWARTAVNWAYETKMMSGTPEGYFMPQNNATRAEGAAIVMNYAKTFYNLSYGYPLPAPETVRANPYNSTSFLLNEETGYLSYLGGPYTRGIDVSSHQKEIDWPRVAATGMDFVMVRAGYRGYTSGSIQKDAYFDANMRGALNNGMKVGVYFFSQALTPAEAEEEAYLLLEWMKGYNITYPVVFDWEEQDKDDYRTQGCDGHTVTACALAFCKVIEDAGYTPMTYGSPKKVYTDGILLEHLQDYPFWLAHYTKDTTPTTFRYHYQMWQYSSSGAVDGIEGRVDLNLCLTPDWSNWSSGYVRPDYSWLLPS